MPSVNDINPELVQEAQQYVKFFDSTEVEVSFRNSENALPKMPIQGLAELDDSGEKMRCFFKIFGIGDYDNPHLVNQLESHLRVVRSTLAPEVRIARLCRVVRVDGGRIAGLLPTYIDTIRENGGTLLEDHHNTPLPL